MFYEHDHHEAPPPELHSILRFKIPSAFHVQSNLFFIPIHLNTTMIMIILILITTMILTISMFIMKLITLQYGQIVKGVAVVRMVE